MGGSQVVRVSINLECHRSYLIYNSEELSARISHLLELEGWYLQAASPSWKEFLRITSPYLIGERSSSVIGRKAFPDIFYICSFLSQSFFIILPMVTRYRKAGRSIELRDQTLQYSMFHVEELFVQNWS
ncbi:hypothetical protein TNCV_3706961 [Trichonephila clavipes]|nr:hypothetical protein TNCV_3706961 [Trichonephila clavipes]